MARGRRNRLRGRWTVVAVVALLAVLTVEFAGSLGIARLPVLAGLVAPRTAEAVGLAVAAVTLVAVAASVRRTREPALALAAVALLGVAGTLPVVLQRGFTAEPVAAEAGTVRILSWNINGHLVAPAVVARLAAQQHADVVVLPEITGASRFPGAFAAAGLRLRAYPAVTDRSAQTFVFVRSGRYSPVVGHSGDPVKSAALTPLDPSTPAVVAVHGAQPTLRENALWRSDLAWVAAKCRDPDTVAVGDFNATLDDFGADGLGGCTDAAADRHAASIGTWPTRLPAWLGMPLDHVLIGRDWTVRSFTVLTDEDGSGARHRPILAVLGRAR